MAIKMGLFFILLKRQRKWNGGSTLVATGPQLGKYIAS